MRKVEITVTYNEAGGNGTWKPLDAIEPGNHIHLHSYDDEVIEGFPRGCISATVCAEHIITDTNDEKIKSCYTMATRFVTFPDKDEVPLWVDKEITTRTQAEEFIGSNDKAYCRTLQEHAKFLKGKLLPHEWPPPIVYNEILRIADGIEQLQTKGENNESK